jgi:murein DD-endopeptidase MepM/ murein hydrolase activator NlpD
MKIFFSLITFVFLSFAFGVTLQKSIQTKKQKNQDKLTNIQEEVPIFIETSEKELAIENKQESSPAIIPNKTKILTFMQSMTFYGVMLSLNMPRKHILEFITIAKPLLNLANLPVGSRLEVTYKEDTEQIIELRILVSEDIILLFEKEKTEGEERWKVKKEDPRWTLERRVYYGVVEDSLWESFMEQHLNDKVVYLFAEIFAWQIDFGRETRKGDQWKILIEEKREKGRLVASRNIIYAEYKKAGGGVNEAVRFPPTAPVAQYYSLDGNNLAGLFLKSPVNFTHISSKFQKKRFHPILKFARPHYGIDYAAARGTPVYAIGDGTIEKAAYSHGSGNYIQIRHNQTYESAYRHLHKFSKQIKTRKKVKQGEVIGYVGSTGLATGPHLHFELLKNKKYIDPLGTTFPRASSIDKSKENEFKHLAMSLQKEFGVISQK